MLARLPGVGSLPKLVEDGLSAMARGERAIISGSAADAMPVQPDALLPAPPADVERIELELELLQFTQVATVLLCRIQLLAASLSSAAMSLPRSREHDHAHVA